jgi:hypothetical protein
VIDFRVILYHKQATSARTRFVRFTEGTILAFGPLTGCSQLKIDGADEIAVHPASISQQTEALLGLPADSLKVETNFQHAVEVDGSDIKIVLASITTIDPPFEIIENAGARFIDLTQARGLPQNELELLRHAYELILGG